MKMMERATKLLNEIKGSNGYVILALGLDVLLGFASF